jgi:hypothetical protein
MALINFMINLTIEGRIMIKRHYFQKRLKNHNHLFPLVWDLPPYEVARFGGELSKVMLEAAKRYICEKSVSKQKTLFKTTAFNNNSPH